LASKGVSKIRVAAFEPQHAHDIAAALLALAEEKVNELNERSEADAIDSSARDVQFAQARLIAAQRAVTDFRTHEMLLDPSASSIGVLQTITTLSTELSQTLVQISESSRLSADAPGLQALKSRADALTVAIAAQRGKIGGAGDSFAPKVAAYEQMNLTLDLAKRELAATSTALELARQEARRKKIYVETVSAPSLPDDTREPQRIRMILTVFVFSSALSSVVWLLKAGVKEHAIE
jgi:capsular polysaccharide transport system permease protein